MDPCVLLKITVIYVCRIVDIFCNEWFLLDTDIKLSRTTRNNKVLSESLGDKIQNMPPLSVSEKSNLPFR